jgi:hypothetical protein
MGSTADYANPAPSSGVVELGSWRVEESPASTASADYFLNVFAVGDNITGVFPSSVTGTTSGNGASATHTGTEPAIHNQSYELGEYSGTSSRTFGA